MKSLRTFLTGWKQIEFTPVFIGAVILGWAGWQNMYPLVYPDTGAYIASGLEGHVPHDRPLLYGLFLRHTSMRATMWFAFFAQSLIVSSVIFAFVKTYFQQHRYHLIFYFLLVPLVTCTALSIKTSTLIPDAFTPLPVLIFFILYRGIPELKLRIWFSTLMVFCIAVHQSHMMILFVTFVLYLSLVLVRGRFRQTMVTMRKFRFMAPVLIASFFLTPLINLIYADKFFWSKSGSIFLMGRLADNGLLQKYVDDNCGKKPLEICNYRDQIPVDFLWDGNSPLHKMGGWEKPSPEFDLIVRDILTTPKYLIPFIYKSASASLVQFFYFPITVRAENAAMSFDTPPHYALRNVFKHEIGLYLFSNQNINRLDYTAIDGRQVWFATILLMVTAAVGFSSLRKKFNGFKNAMTLILLYTMANAIICGTLSIPNPRYQTRVFWLLPLVMMMALLHLWLNHRQAVIRVFNENDGTGKPD